MNLIKIFLPIIVTFFLTIILTIIFLPVIKRLKLIDDPKTHKHPAILHNKPIPRGGGLPIFIGILISSIFFIPLTKVTIGLFMAGFLALITGIIDDRYDISRYVRFFINIICAVIVVSSGITIPFITNPLGNGILHFDSFKLSFEFFGLNSFAIISDSLSILWIIWVMNMLNWSKGVDGQMPGVVAISSFVIGLLSLRFGQTGNLSITASSLSFIITGASLGFLIFNFYPAKIFPGYGATAMYLLLASVAVLSSVKLATAILVMVIPITDGIFTILRRFSSGKSPFYGDKKHLHHLLLKIGFNQQQVALFYWIVSAIVGGVSLILSSQQKVFTILVLGVIFTGSLLFLHKITNKNAK